MQPMVRRKFQLTDLLNNNNKTWMVEWWSDGSARTTWGRTDTTQQSADYSAWDERTLSRKIGEKIKKGYVEVELPVITARVSNTVLDERITRFIAWINQEAGRNIRKTSGDIEGLSEAQLARGRHLLMDIQQARQVGNRVQETTLVETYFRTIPTRLPHKIVVDDILKRFDLREQENRLNQLETALATAHASSTEDVYAILGAELKPIEADSQTFQQISQLIKTSASHAHIEDIFGVRIPPERARFDAAARGKHYVATLFHGTKVYNVRHILREGLKLPTVRNNGKLLGWGIYAAPSAYKALSYAQNAGTDLRVLFACDVALGSVASIALGAEHLRQPPEGHDSVVGNEHAMPEYAIYDPAQITIRAVITLKGKGVRF